MRKRKHILAWIIAICVISTNICPALANEKTELSDAAVTDDAAAGTESTDAATVDAAADEEAASAETADEEADEVAASAGTTDAAADEVAASAETTDAAADEDAASAETTDAAADEDAASAETTDAAADEDAAGTETSDTESDGAAVAIEETDDAEADEDAAGAETSDTETDGAAATNEETDDAAAADEDSAAAAKKGAITEEVIAQSVTPDDLSGRTDIASELSDEELYAAYIDDAFSQNLPEGGANRKALTKAGSRLTGYSKQYYDLIAAELPGIAAGSRASTVFTLTAGNSKAWTFDELGIAETIERKGITGEVQSTVVSQISKYLNIDLNLLVRALLADFPYEMYWYNKTVSTPLVYKLNWDMSAKTVGFESSSIKYPVSKDYADYSDTSLVDAGTGASYCVDTATGKTVQTAVANAKGIVNAHKSESDYQRLCSYRKEICALTSYNTAAAATVSDSSAYGNPNQMVWVFDRDPNTSVLCEGYAKAFKYLCDLTDFSGAIDCITVTGYLDGDIPHMWNVVRMEDKCNYLADLTNCDEGTMGADDRLFLIGAASAGKMSSGGRETGCTVYPDGDMTTYQYDTNTLHTYTNGQLAINTRSYALNDDMVQETDDVTYTGSAIAPVRIVDCGTTLKAGTDYTVSYKNSNTAAGSVQNIDVGTVTATITGAGRYKGTVKTSFRIVAKNVTPAVALSTTKYVYSGKVRKPIAAVKVGGVKLPSSSYTVTYAGGRKNVGTYKVKVKLRGNYSGSKVVSFRIIPKGTRITSLKANGTKITVKWRKQKTQTTGFQIQFCTNKKFKSGVKTKTVKGAAKVSKVYGGFKKGKKYYFRIRSYKTVSGKKYYSAWSSARSVKVNK